MKDDTEIKFLADWDLTDLHETFLRAFSDYLVPMNLNRRQFQQLLERRGARNDISVGVFQNGAPVGFTINAFETYQGQPTAYDVVTGIVPEARHRGLARKIFEFSLHSLRSVGATRYLLEVFENNEPAFRLYEKIGFSTTRKLEVFTRSNSSVVEPRGFKLKAIEPDWKLFRTFWDWEPSWQNSNASLQRSSARKSIAGVFHDSKLIGYGVIFLETADIAQFAIHPDHRRKGAGMALINHLQSLVGTTVRVVNVEGSAAGTIGFLKQMGFGLLGRQNEMAMNFKPEPAEASADSLFP